MNRDDALVERLNELRAAFVREGLEDEAIEEVFHLAESLVAERDAARGLLYGMMGDLISERARYIAQERSSRS